MHASTHREIEGELTVHVKDGTHESYTGRTGATSQLNYEVRGRQSCASGLWRIDI